MIFCAAPRAATQRLIMRRMGGADSLGQNEKVT